MLFWRTRLRQRSDEDLMVLIAGGDVPAFDELYRRYHKRLHVYFLKMLHGDADLADDFLQDLFLKIIEKPHLFSPERKLKTWLYTLATNLCRNEYRRRGIRLHVPEEEIPEAELAEQEGMTAALDKAYFSDLLAHQLARLDETQRITLTLRFQEDLSIKEIAQILDCAEGTVKSRLFYTLKKLNQQLHAFNPNTL